jgi:hypothetical protein
MNHSGKLTNNFWDKQASPVFGREREGRDATPGTGCRLSLSQDVWSARMSEEIEP